MILYLQTFVYNYSLIIKNGYSKDPDYDYFYMKHRDIITDDLSSDTYTDDLNCDTNNI